ncbi:oplophorus-luciferin 2-monooxygenase non-catalytic subunit-like [Limulus polyphemus]|uniref:Oplophorus-luciferin 2-monooxygenase non-catalytic subunit-like n=1 Tax=Limulus polyphemus TaxID=6850 RepID=A0ABM1B7H3_LIMPO|nr:oplophorus-luciferin 2-monooxygenase non-catalytic subunit-like [Limulus polyphemus]
MKGLHLVTIACMFLFTAGHRNMGPGQGAPTSGCPSEELFLPCECEGSAVIQCNKAKTTSEVVESFKQKFEDFGAFGTFHMKNTPVSKIPSRLFGPAKFYSFRITGNLNLNSVEDNAFAGSEPFAEHIDISNNAISSPSVFQAISKLDQLKYINLENNSLTEVPNNAFGNQALQFISLRYNKIQSVGQYAFQHLANLERLDLRNNLITLLQDNVFDFVKTTVDYTSIALENNKISDVSNNALVGLKRSEVLLSNNLLTTLKAEAFQSYFEKIVQFNGRAIVLKDNPFYCDCRVKWIVENKSYWPYIGAMTCHDGRNIQSYKVEELEDC